MAKKSDVLKAYRMAAKKLEKEIKSKEFKNKMDEIVKDFGGYKKKK